MENHFLNKYSPTPPLSNEEHNKVCEKWASVIYGKMLSPIEMIEQAFDEEITGEYWDKERDKLGIIGKVSFLERVSQILDSIKTKP